MKRASKKYVILLPCIVIWMLLMFTACSLLGLGEEKIEKVELKAEHISFFSGRGTYAYTGYPIEPESDVSIVSPEGIGVSRKEFTFSYSENVNVGTAHLTATAKEDNKYFYGSATIDFQITAGIATVSDTKEAVELLNGNNVYQINIIGHMDFTGYDVTVKSGVTVTVMQTPAPKTFTTGENFVNNGTIKFDPTMNGYRGTDVFICGNFQNNGELMLGDYTELFNGGNFENNGTFQVSNSKIYTNDEAIPNVTYLSGGVARQWIRTQITAEDILWKAPAPTYSPEDTPERAYAILVGGEEAYVAHDHVYRDADRAGTAYLDITIRRNDTNYYGSVTIPYQVIKATVEVADIAEMQAYQETGNYGTFRFDEFNVPAGEQVTLEEGNTIEAQEVNILGTFENCGTVVGISDSKYGNYFRVNASNATGRAALINRGTGEIRAGVFMLFENSDFTNEGKLVFERSMYFHGSAVNRGTIVGTDIDFNNDFENFGTLELYGGEGYTDYTDFSMATNGQGKFVNHGTVTLYGDAVVREGSALENAGGTVEVADGTVYAYTGTSFFPSDKVVLKKQLELSDLNGLYTAAKVYNETYQTISLDDSLGLKADYVEITYYSGESRLARGPSTVGEYTVTIKVKSERTKFYGTLEGIPYHITPAHADIATQKDFERYAGNANYNDLTLTADLVFTAGYSAKIISIENGVTLHLNGHKLTVDGTAYQPSYTAYHARLVVSGTLDASVEGQYPLTDTPTSLEACNLKVIRGGELSINGTLINGGLFYMDSDSKLDTFGMVVGNVINSGKMYLSGTGVKEQFHLTDTGVIYERERLQDLPAERLYLTETVLDYNGKEQMPAVVCKDKRGQELNLEDSARFAPLQYTNNVNTGYQGQAYVTVAIADENPFDEELTGSKMLRFTVQRSMVEVSSFAQLKAATEDLNYLGYQLTATFSLESNLPLADGTILDFGRYTLYPNMHRLIASSQVTLQAEVGSLEHLQSMVFVDKIKLYKSFDTNGATLKLRNTVDRDKYPENSLDGNPLLPSSYMRPHTELALDLNGFTISGGLKIDIAFIYYNTAHQKEPLNFTITNSSETGGAIDGALDVTAGNSAFHLTLSGIRTGGLILGKAVSCTATDCEFNGENEFAYNTGECNFTSCKFTGDVGLSLVENTNTFTRCEFTGDVGLAIGGGANRLTECEITGGTGVIISKRTNGSSIFKDCTITANGALEEGVDPAGIYFKAADYFADVLTIDGGSITSANSYCISSGSTNAVTVRITQSTLDDESAWSFGEGTGRFSEKISCTPIASLP